VHRISRGDEAAKLRQLSGASILISRVLAAQGGRAVARFTGGGTVQTPGIFAAAAARAAERATRTMQPGSLFVQAIMDPKWERVLMSREPRTTAEMRKFTKSMQRL